MKIIDIAGGVVDTLPVRPAQGAFEPLPRSEQEAVLFRSADQTLLTLADAVRPVEGATPADHARLLEVVGSGLPMVAFVAQAYGDRLVLHTRRFALEKRVIEPMEIGVDEKVLDDVRRSHKYGGTVAEVGAWLMERLVAPPAPHQPPDLRRLVVSGNSQAFRIFGHRAAVDVKLVDGQFRIDRVLKSSTTGSHRLSLLYAPVSFVDATLAAAVHGEIRTALSEAVARNTSYLGFWQLYHQLERNAVLERARALGALEYRSCEKRRDGGWQFRMAQGDDQAERLAVLGEGGHLELEAGEEHPVFDEERLSVRSGNRPDGGRGFCAAILRMDDRTHTLDLAPPEEDDNQSAPPPKGFLFLSLRGDQARLRRRERAAEALRTGNCPMPQLGLLMEGHPAVAARRGQVSASGSLLRPVIREVFGETGPTRRQLEAIDTALNTPDICLIQGPPGTGKTKVITAIEQCLAVLADEGVEPSHRILVSAAQHDAVENVAQRTQVFGLPAMTVGRRRWGRDADFDPALEFAKERVEQLRARSVVPLEAERLNRARSLALICLRGQALPADQAQRLRAMVKPLEELLAPELLDLASQHAAALDAPGRAGEVEAAGLMLKAARGIRVEPGPFSDDGPVQARKALRRLDAVLTAEERSFLEKCAALDLEEVPDWLAEGRAHRDALVDRLAKPCEAEPAQVREDTQSLVLDILDAVERQLASTRSGADGVVAAYLNDLENDPGGVRAALQHYTVVLASTLQHAASQQMCRLRGVEEGSASFETVIVDEAARANPLDLFIPLSMAKRRAVLVGDHRQLPHLMEPVVERKLSDDLAQGRVEEKVLKAVQSSLFARMWELLKDLELKDGIKRTVTLNAQYRMHPVLGEFISKTFYEAHGDGHIESPRPPGGFGHRMPGYLKKGVPCVAGWLDVPSETDRDQEVRGASKRRPAEARAIAREVRRLMDQDPTLTFGVISFYSAQVDEIGRAMLETGLTEKTQGGRGWRIADAWSTTYNARGQRVERLRIGTVDAFQGKEFDVVLLSVTRSNQLPGETDEQQRRKYGHLMLPNRLCVAMSRQQRLLIGVGDRAFVLAPEAANPLHALRAFLELCGGQHGVIIR